MTHRQKLTQALGTLNAVDEFNERLWEVILTSVGPRYWGYVIDGTRPGSIVGEWLATAFDQ